MDFKTLAAKINGRLLNNELGKISFKGVSIDTRTLQAQQLFFAIRGESNDGHKYIADAVTKNSAGLVVAADFAGLGDIGNRVPVVVVENTHEAMMHLAAAYREKLSAEIVAVTGSNGKTTTKEFIFAMIRYKEKETYGSPGNLNNLYGLPLAIFAMPSGSRYGVFELGISIPGEMTRLANIIHPDLAVITNVGPTHLETLGTVEGVAKAKLELADSMDSDKPVIINADDPVLTIAVAARKHRFVTYGVRNKADFTAALAGVSKDGFPIAKIDGAKINIKIFGQYQIYNLLAGYTVCRTLGLDIKPDELNNVDYRFATYRGEIENIEGLTIIADCYNANPASMTSGLKSFKEYMGNASTRHRRSVAVIGDMLELGEKSTAYHQDIGRFLAELDFDYVLTVGPLSKNIYETAVAAGLSKKKIKHSENTNDAGEVLVNDILRGDIVYLKASRGIALEKLITLLKGAAFRQN
ncbi:MAG: UDP-N-acetylmuramoyl-tripeptide--D-alanyl-D-alanine ligase [Candidatus Zixiibacteriota bacterium]